MCTFLVVNSMTMMRGRCCRLWALLVARLCLGISLSQGLAQSAAISASNSRRSFLAGSLSVSTFFVASAHAAEPVAPLVPGGSASLRSQIEGSWNDLPLIETQLGKSRILASELSPLQQPLFGDQELYYPPFLFGAWNVRATLKRKIYPYGVEYLPSTSLKEGSPRNREEKVGNECRYEVHYFSTLANTLQNQATVNLGIGIPQPKVIQDRAFNAISLSNAYQQLTPVQEVDWNYRDTPTKVLLGFGAGPLDADMRPLGPRRAEVFINARKYEAGDENTYCTAERSRSVTLVTRDALVSDTETITEFHKQSPDHVTAVSRIAVYLTPNPNSREGVLWQQTGGKAVAFFDYDIDMSRIKEEFTMSDGTKQQRACVKTPKDVVQCD